MKLTIINDVVINIEYIEFVEKQNDGSILVVMNSGAKKSFREKEAQNLMYWLNEILYKGC